MHILQGTKRLAGFAFTCSLIFLGDAGAQGMFSDKPLKSSIDAAGRNVMRTADGGLVAAFAVGRTSGSGLVFSRSLNNGRTWDNLPIEGGSGSVSEVALDSNFNGSYVAFTEKSGRSFRGRIAYLSDPFGGQPSVVLSEPVTPAGVRPFDTSIQASRAGWGNLASDDRETVAYGWQDAKSKAIYIGVSIDGKTFPPARLVIDDKFAISGPAVAIRGQFVIATYLTTSPAIQPRDVTTADRGRRAYPAWIESFDAGTTWSRPSPLFGHSSADFPSTEIEQTSGNFKQVRLAGGTSQRNSPILNWASSAFDGRVLVAPDADKTLPMVVGKSTFQIDRLAKDFGGTTFVQSSMVGIDTAGKSGEVSIVSFRAIELGAKWTHVIANNKLTGIESRLSATTSKDSVLASQFQYSALIDTAVRATIYKEVDPQSKATRLVAAVSTDTGKSFRNHLSFNREQLQSLGIEDFGNATVFAASQCLFEDRDGKVYIDVIFANDKGMNYARVPIGVNAADLRAEKKK